MSRRARISLLILVAGIGLVLFFMFQKAPSKVDLVYDLGSDHASITRVTVAFLDQGRVLRQTEWRFEPGAAPRQLSQKATLPKRMVTLRVILVRNGKAKVQQRPFDANAQGEKVVIHLAG